MKRIAVNLILGTIAFCSNLQAQGQAGQAGEYLRWGVGAKALGFGRAFTSVADDASALYWNPAGMAALSRNGGTVMFMHLPLQEGASMNYLGGALPLRLFFIKNANKPTILNALQELKLGIGALWYSLGQFEFYNAEAAPITGTDFDVRESAVFLSASYPLNGLFKRWVHNQSSWLAALRGDLEFGLTTKFLRQNIFQEVGTAKSVDVGLKYTHASGIFSLGLLWRDLNSPRFSYDSDLIADKIPANGVLGVSAVPPFGRLRGLLLSFDYGILPPAGRSRDLMFGLEYDFSVLNADYPIKLRLGTNKNHESITLGLQFSPEGLFDQDWLPSADWTHATDRSRFDAVGQRYSFSLDRNPFTARYWYLNGLQRFSSRDCRPESGNTGHTATTLRYMRNALEAKNPGNYAYRYEAALRIADLRFLSELGEIHKEEFVNDHEHLNKKFRAIVDFYMNKTSKYHSMDYGKSKFDSTNYVRSFLFYVQALILAGKADIATQEMQEKGRTWGRKLNVLAGMEAQGMPEKEDYFNYLKAYALLSSSLHLEAIRTLEENLTHSASGRFLLAHISFLTGNYAQALKHTDAIDLNAARFPEDLYLPVTRDCTFGDEVLFLKAASIYKLGLNEEKRSQFVVELSKIPRFFPRSDLARFLTNGDGLLHALIDYYARGLTVELDELIASLIHSYIETSSGGRLFEKLYTFNYR